MQKMHGRFIAGPGRAQIWYLLTHLIAAVWQEKDFLFRTGVVRANRRGALVSVYIQTVKVTETFEGVRANHIGSHIIDTHPLFVVEEFVRRFEFIHDLDVLSLSLIHI